MASSTSISQQDCPWNKCSHQSSQIYAEVRFKAISICLFTWNILWLFLDLNDMEVRPPKEVVRIEAIPSGAAEESKYIVKQEQSFADNILVVGERYQPVDFKSVCSLHLGKFSSGVLSKVKYLSTALSSIIILWQLFYVVLGINHGIKTAYKLRENKPIRVYHVTGRFGRSTESHFNDSPVTVRASFEHVNLNKLNSLLSSLQASHQKKMFELCGVDIQTQAAFELAVQGPLRPTVSNIPLIYSLRCIDFKKPYFTIGENMKDDS